MTACLFTVPIKLASEWSTGKKEENERNATVGPEYDDAKDFITLHF